jgi:tRNA(adenine34) deaminase
MCNKYLGFYFLAFSGLAMAGDYYEKNMAELVIHAWGNDSESSFVSDLAISKKTMVDKMRELIKYAKENNPEYPFAAMIVETKSGKEICRGINNSISNPTLHGEIATINNCVYYGRNNLDWSNLTLITTAEPCPMCQGAIIWTGIGKVVYGTSIQHLIEKGWRQINITSEEVCSRSNFNKPEIIGGVLAEKTNALFVDRKKIYVK